MLLISSRIDLDAVFVLVKDHDERTTTVFKLPGKSLFSGTIESFCGTPPRRVLIF
jgi:hypothetical protein